MQFFINSVETTLKIGGVACHTTEFNLSSNDETVSKGDTVLYRRRDMEESCAAWKSEGTMSSHLPWHLTRVTSVVRWTCRLTPTILISS